MRSVFVAAGSFLTASLFLTFTPLAFGQGGTGTITGTVSDPTGLGSRWSYRASHQRRNRWRLYRGNNCRRKLHRPEFAGRHLRIVRDGARLQDVHAPQPDHRGGANPEGRHTSASGRDHRVHNRRRRSLAPDTQTGDSTHNVTVKQLDELPLLGIGTVNSGTSGYRNPYNTLL